MKNPLITAVAYAISQVLGSFAARRLSDLMFLVAGTVSIVFFTIITVLYQTYQGDKLGKADPLGLLFVFLSNGAITIFLLFLARSFQEFDSKFVIPFVFGIAILLSTVVVFITNKTFPTFYEVISLLLISGGLVLLGSVHLK